MFSILTTSDWKIYNNYKKSRSQLVSVVSGQKKRPRLRYCEGGLKWYFTTSNFPCSLHTTFFMFWFSFFHFSFFTKSASPIYKLEEEEEEEEGWSEERTCLERHSFKRLLWWSSETLSCLISASNVENILWQTEQIISLRSTILFSLGQQSLLMLL